MSNLNGKPNLKVGDEFIRQSAGDKIVGKIVKLHGISVVVEGLDELVCVPIDATRVELFKDDPLQPGDHI